MTPARLRNPRRSGGFSLLEAIATITILAVAVPPSVAMLVNSTRSRMDTMRATEATWLVTSVLETILADVASDASGLGFGALDDADTYVNALDTGLLARLSDLTAAHQARGLEWTLIVSDPVAADGATSGDADQDVYRRVTARISWTRGNGEGAQMNVSIMAAEQ